MESRTALAVRIGEFYARSPNAAYTNAALGAIAVAAMWTVAPRELLLVWSEIGRAHV